MSVDAEDFPRGGAPVLSALEVRKIRAKAEDDVLFGNHEDQPVQKAKPAKKSTSKIVKDKEDTKPAAGKVVETFSFKYLKRDMLILGNVKELLTRDVVIGLPNGLSGYLLRSELESSPNEEEDDEEEDEQQSSAPALTVGTLVPVCVMELHKQKHGHQKIRLSMLPLHVNKTVNKTAIQKNMLVWGMVASVEDHGAVVSIGKLDVSGFLPNKHASESHSKGSFHWFTVTSISENLKVAMLSTKLTKQMKGAVKFASLLPGQLCEVVVTESSEMTISGLVHNSFPSVLHSTQLPARAITDDVVQTGKLKVRIIHVDHRSKQIGLSMLPSVLSFSSDQITKARYTSGEILEDCIVKQAEATSGLLMEIHGADDSIELGHVHISRVSDERVEKLGKAFKVGTSHRCRVLGYSAMDGMFTLTMQKSVLSKQFMAHSELKPGMVVTCSVLRLCEFGALLKITEQIRGLIPTTHLADVRLRHPEKKFYEGRKIKCRVLQVRADAKKVALTHKKTMVRSEHDLICDFSVKRGAQAHGWISDIKPRGLFISFYNNVRGMIHKSAISLPENESLESAYFLGQVLLCTVVSANPEKRRINLSLKPLDSLPPAKPSCQYGERVSVSVVEADDSHLSCSYADTAVLRVPFTHLSDFREISECYRDRRTLMSGDQMELVYLGWSHKNKVNTATRKEILKHNDPNKVKQFSDLQVGQVLVGVISHIMSYGVFVEVAPGINGLAPNSHLADQYVADASDLFTEGQSVLVLVTELNSEKQRFLVSLKPSVLSPSMEVESEADEVEKSETDEEPQSTHKELIKCFCGIELLKIYLRQRKELIHEMQLKDKQMETLSSIQEEVILVKVTAVKSDGVYVTYHDPVQECNVDGYVPTALKFGSDVECGEERQVLVVFSDLAEKKFIATFHEELITSVIKINKKKKRKIKLVPEVNVEASVLHVTSNVVVLHLTQTDRLAFMPARMHLNDVSDPIRKFVLNQKLSTRFTECYDDHILMTSITESSGKIEVGAMVDAIVKGVKPTQLSVSMNNGKMFGRIHISQITDQPTERSNPMEDFKPNQLIRARVMELKDMKTHNHLPISHQHSGKMIAELSVKPSAFLEQVTDNKSLEGYKTGESCACYITSVNRHCVWMTISPVVKGKLPLLHFSEDVKELRQWNSLEVGQCFSCEVTGQDQEQDCLLLSKIGVTTPLLKGASVVGRVSKVLAHAGLLVELPHQRSGFVDLTELMDDWTDEPLKRFTQHQFVRCAVLSVKNDKRIDLSIRPSRTGVKETTVVDRPISSYDDIKEGDILRGYVKSCCKVGVFVRLSGSITGRVQIKNLSQYFVKDFAKLFPVGKLVKAKILSIDPATNRIDLSLRGKDVGGPDPAPAPKRKNSETESADKDDDDVNDTEESPTKKKKIDLNSNDESDVDDVVNSDEDIVEDDDDDDHDVVMRTDDEPSACLELGSAYDWSSAGDSSAQRLDESSASENESDDQSEEAKLSARKSKRQKRAEKKAEEESIHKAEMTLLDTERGPQTADDFERLVLASADSSLVWIRFMAFYLHSAEVEKARAVAQRAIKTINFREEQEKLNVCMALLNLENTYGSQESLNKAFQEALKVNEPKKVYTKMADIYCKSDKQQAAEKLFSTMTKQFSTSKKVWISFGLFLMNAGRAEEARKLLQRSLKSLAQRKHIETIVKFAMMEWRVGEAQRGTTMMESVLKNYPSRTDLWSVYIDQTIKSGDWDLVRNIFERATSLTLRSKKMRFLFKRYLEFETQHGTPVTVEHVRTRATEYVHSLVDHV